jgi:NAD(P)-dependent dehydrogenase (short-subunit alcohol dehydrogenase family)
VLITGCSTGIGAATAAELARDFSVYATARDVATLKSLERQGCRVLQLDVTDEGSMVAAVHQVEADAGSVGALVNNAGYSQSGALETLPLASVRAQFETNVFGLLRMSQLVLPGMRRAGRGRIVNIGSMGGRLTFPGGGAYHATKYAVEAISDALRFEVRGFGIRVVLIEPGLITTEFARTAVASVDRVEDDGPYAQFNRAVRAGTAGAYEGPLGRLGGGPETVARTVRKALTAARPRARYTVTPSAKLALAQRALSPDALWDRMLRTQFPVPGP